MAAKDCSNSATPQKPLLQKVSRLRSHFVSTFGAKTSVGMAVRIVLLATPVLAVPLIGAATSNVTFTEDFEAGDFSQWGQQLCCQHSAQVVSSPTRAGEHAAKFTLRKSDPTRGNPRAELVLDPVPANSERWYGFSVFVPQGDKDSSYEIITQWAGRPDRKLGEDWRIPIMTLNIGEDRFGVSNRWDSRQVTPRREGQNQKWDLGLVPKGQWVDFVFHTKWSYQSNGLLEVWKDGKLVIRKTGPNTYNDRTGPFLKMGIYKPQWKAQPRLSQTTERVVYFDEVRIGDASASYQAVAPGPRSISPISFQCTN